MKDRDSGDNTAPGGSTNSGLPSETSDEIDGCVPGASGSPVGSSDETDDFRMASSCRSSGRMRRPLPALAPQLDMMFVSNTLWILRRIADSDLLLYAGQSTSGSQPTLTRAKCRIAKSLSQDAALTSKETDGFSALRCSYTDLFMLSGCGRSSRLHLLLTT
ncbi:unnamed protein product [Protopolystoma xenopodis]|uniref:Uncharacterized protein n=1 Tax=Protopolystoma xenopodis TaxID=117903 RepID=A0A448XBX5_9PLAT|nr:unnamed protein product [Protopolystoma xenopodis]